MSTPCQREQSNKRVFVLLVLGFAIFYAVQVPSCTVSSDVIVFALRSIAPRPLVHHAYLDDRSLLHGAPLPNYHLAHTVLLWLAYKFVPGWLRESIVPAGLFSALCGGLIVGLTFLLWTRLGLRKREAMAVACVAGIVPSIWYHSLIGEVYVPQLAAVLLFALLFLYSRYFLAALALLLALLVSPLSALLFPLAFLGGWNKRAIKFAAMVGGLAVLGYLAVHMALGSSPLAFIRGIGHEAVARPLPYKLLCLVGILMLNLNVLLFLLLKGLLVCLRERRELLLTLALATAPYLCLPLVSADFLVDKGCFLLPLFWALAMPIGVAIVRGRFLRTGVLLSLVAVTVVTMAVWTLPSQHLASRRAEVGVTLRARFGDGIKVMGDWGTALPVTVSMVGWDYERVASHYFDVSFPSQADFEASGEDSLLIAVGRKGSLRRQAARLPLPGFAVEGYVPKVASADGHLESILANEHLAVYLWTRRH
ncbi:MAG: hypothetical protein QHJ34_04675 [bacterium]|jgi:hypothetical protein|nr:hypothetical protein [candidate division KSB1 bacterium]MDH7559512.1 hypothetical protein [bacterium]